MSKTIENNNLIYKFYNVNNELLYVGITNSMKLRLRQHKQDKPWANEIKKICVSDKMTRNEAHIYEIYYIANENPLYNVDYLNGGKVSFIISELLFKEYKKEKRKKINIEILVDMYNKGKTIEEIAKELKYSIEYIAQNLNFKLIECGEVKPRHGKNTQDERFGIFVDCLKSFSGEIFFTIDDIINKFANIYDCAKETAKWYYKKEFNTLVNKELENLGLSMIRANSELKRIYNISTSGYPLIICNK